MVIAVSDKIDWKPKAVSREKDHFIMIKGIIKFTVISNNVFINRSKERSRQKYNNSRGLECPTFTSG